MELPTEPKPLEVKIEFVTFLPMWEESETHAKQVIANLIEEGYEIVTAAGSGDGAQINDYQTRNFVTVILQRKPPKLAWITER